jgi:hypothetical protein
MTKIFRSFLIFFLFLKLQVTVIEHKITHPLFQLIFYLLRPTVYTQSIIFFTEMKLLLLGMVALLGLTCVMAKDDESKKESVGTVIGIDLGTTYSWYVEYCIASY